MPNGSGGSNDKNLVPEVYSMEKPKWPSWSLRFRRYFNRKSSGLGGKLAAVEGKTAPLSEEFLNATDIDLRMQEELTDYALSSDGRGCKENEGLANDPSSGPDPRPHHGRNHPIAKADHRQP